MSTDTALIDSEAIRGTFRQWRAEQEPLDAELAESLSALSAYQSHLDDWHAKLARERDDLRAAREQLDRDRAASESDHAKFNQVNKELNEARDKIAALTTMLLSRTEELRTLDNRRAEDATELELTRARERDFAAKLDELKQVREQEQAQWAEESRHLRELLEHRLETSETESPAAAADPPPRNVQRSESDRDDPQADNPVLASIMEQFGKLRQQRTQDRPALKKAR
jgi:chromosome segregation ATPase